MRGYKVLLILLLILLLLFLFLSFFYFSLLLFLALLFKLIGTQQQHASPIKIEQVMMRATITGKKVNMTSC